MKSFWKILRAYIPPYRKYLAGSVVMNILSAVFNVFSFSLLIPILQILFNVSDTTYEFIPWHKGMDFGELTNNVYWYVYTLIDRSGAERVLLGLCLVFCLIVLIKTACYFGAAAVMVPIRTGVVKDMRMQIYNKIISLPLGFFSQERKGDIIARISGDVQEVETSITSTIEMLIKNPILIVIYMTVLFVMSWQLTIFTLLFAPLMVWIMSVIGRKLKARSAEAQKYWSDTMSQVEETLGGLRIIKAFLAEGKMSGRFENVTDSMRRKNNRVAIRQASAHPVSEFLGSVMIAIVLWFGGTLILGSKSVIDAPAFMSYMAILYSVIQPIKDFSKAAYGIPKGLASMDRINVILNAENNIKERENPVRIKSFNDSIRFEAVDFFYEQGGKQILQGINLEIKKGRNIAIVGASGAGKSTLVDLIPRFYDPSAGSISIDGTDLKDISTRDLRALMGNVNQDPILFNDTIFNNIAFGVENATMEQVVAAAKIANAHDFIMEKEQGYQTNIGDRGQLLSGGQRQRISIARAILKNPPILILDEATASLDTESERMVQEALDYLMSNRTTISIAHRLSTVRKADEIIVMNEGRIVERGTHDELIEKNGYYKKLYEMQVL
ncbi:MAG: ABC transporter ATP-binding protein [Candidatus Cryptobacteroides sp.]